MLYLLVIGTDTHFSKFILLSMSVYTFYFILWESQTTFDSLIVDFLTIKLVCFGADSILLSFVIKSLTKQIAQRKGSIWQK